MTDSRQYPLVVMTESEEATVARFGLDQPSLGSPAPEQGRSTRDLLESLVDEEPCWFDHSGGCQSHGYLSLEPGDLCPQAELKSLLALFSPVEGNTK